MIDAARKFINRVMEEEDLRDRLICAENNEAREQILEQEGLVFSFAEFDEAYSSEIASSQTGERADEVAQVRLWWEMLLQS